MAIQRWEMLLSAQADCYLLKIQGDRVDVDRIVQDHPHSCQSVQEISGDIFQWVIFVVDAPLAERLAIQNQVMSLTNDTAGEKPSDELLGILDGLSSALQDLTNLTDDEQAFVMNKMARMGSPTPALAVPTTPPLVPGRPPAPPGTYPPAGSPLPRVTIPGRPGSPLPPKPPLGPITPGKPGVGSPLPSPGPLPNIVRPVMPPRSFPGGAPPGAPRMPGVPLTTPLPSIPMPKITPPPAPIAKNVAPAAPPPPVVPPIPIPIPQKPAVDIRVVESPKLPKPVEEVKMKVESPPAPAPVAETILEPLATTPPPAMAPTAKQEGIAAESPTPLEPPVPTPAPVIIEPAPPPVKTEENAALRVSIFYSTGQESLMNQFLSTLTEVAQKKSKRPTAFQVALAVPTEVALENSTEWIWKAKTSGSDIFFVILPDGMGSEIMDPLVGEALSAGLRCFIVPQSEVSSKLLYMDLMVELMMFQTAHSASLPMTSVAPPDSAFGSGDTRLIPVYTFEEFVVGPHNRFPHAASLAVSENLGKAYNPLFLYGPVGIGKTHLMQSVGHRVLQRDPKMRVIYVTAQQFMTEVIELLQAGKLQSLRERYRALDLLLVDDIQFLATSEATQEEFFHMFNDLHASGKQIIMTSDRPPKMLTTLEDRLRSRFEWGLIADIKFTNLETRVAILKKKEGHLKGMHLADDIRLYIASRLKSNIRELEGFLRRIQAYTQLYNEDISLDLVKEILKELLPPEEWVHEGDAKGAPDNSLPSLSNSALKEMEGFDLQPSQFSAPRPVHPPRENPPSPTAAPSPENTTPKGIVPDPPKKEEPTVVPVKPAPPAAPIENRPPPAVPSPQKTDPVPEIDHKTNDRPKTSSLPDNPVVIPTPPLAGERPPVSAPPPDISSPPPPTPTPSLMPGMPRMPSVPLPLPKVSQEKNTPTPSFPKPNVAPPSLTPVAGSGKGGLPSVGIPANPGQIPVVFFYPVGHDKELVQMKRKFDDIINKHKLKFVLHPALEVDYTPSPTIEASLFIDKCRQAGVSIGVVLAPSPDTAVQEGIFFSHLQEAFDQAQLSLQMVPWDELTKDYRFLNLALDITLIRIKQRKS